VIPADVASIRGGRLLAVEGGLLDLATGLSVRLESTRVTAPGPWNIGAGDRPVGACGRTVVLDAWTTQDPFGRWRRLRVLAEAKDFAGAPPASDGEPVDLDNLSGQHPSRVGITRVPDRAAWCRLAAMARGLGLVPVHVDLLPRLDVRGGRQWPPLLIAVRDEQEHVPASVVAWVAHGGRVAALAAMRPDDLPVMHTIVPAAAPRSATTRPAPQTALVHRAWRHRTAAPAAPAFRWHAHPTGGRTRMTHLELLDVTAALEDLRRDDDALAAMCGAVRQHTGARRAAVLAVKAREVRVLATDDASAEAVQAWQRLCLEDGLDGLASATGWHAAGRHGACDDMAVYVCGTWPSRDEAIGRGDLLAVFARIAAARVPPPVAAPVAGAPLAETLVGDSVVMQDVRAQIALAARAPFPVLIRGESGCGKELAARAIHALGLRRHRRCAAINCAALPDELIESELFGHVRGAFTGASADRAGLFDEADGGTLFLDEVGELGVRGQAKLLRVLQDGEVRRVGENTARRVDVRVIAATNVSLEEAVRRGTFRADLFYRLDVVRVRMPALRERRDDIPELARHFWRECAARVGSRARLDGAVLDALARCDWPGNVRQLQNTLAALAVRVPPRGRVGVDDLPPDLRAPEAPEPEVVPAGLGAARRAFEATYVRNALSRAGGRPARAARDLGLTRQGLSKLVRRLGLEEAPDGPRLP
jgi:DNA-binding NtrC family response regulator